MYRIKQRPRRLLLPIATAIILLLVYKSYSFKVKPAAPVEILKSGFNWSSPSQPCYTQPDEIYDQDHTRNHMEYWKSMNDDEISRYRQDWKEFVSKIPARSPSSNNRGIVYTSHSGILKYTLVSIKLLRKFGCSLPIEVWYFGDELSSDQLSKLKEIKNVETNDLSMINDSRFKFTKPEGDKMFEMKGASLVFSKFDQILFLDSDVIIVIRICHSETPHSCLIPQHSIKQEQYSGKTFGKRDQKTQYSKFWK